MSTYTRIPYNPPGPSTKFPYSTADLTPSDPSSDASFYTSPRFVTHIDDDAIRSLTEYYSADLPRKGRILDLCSSWVSHYPPEIEESQKRGELEVFGMGMNQAELKANRLFGGKFEVRDLNSDPSLPDSIDHLDSTTCVVSVDYLTKPVEVLTAVRSRTKPKGTIHLTVSNRCFPTKVISRWLGVDEDERLKMCGDYLWYAGWRDIEILVLSDGLLKKDQGGSTSSFLGRYGLSRCDPLWVVRGKNIA